MIKDIRLKAIEELKKDFKAADKSVLVLSGIYKLLDADYIPNDMDVYEVSTSSRSKSMIDGWTSHTNENVFYDFYVELIKEVNDKIASEWVKIEHDEKDLLIKLHDILQGY